jgi:hypothetical protein
VLARQRWTQSEPIPLGKNRITASRNKPIANCQLFGKYALEKDRTNSSAIEAMNAASTL